MVETYCSNFRMITAIFWVFKYLGNLWYYSDDTMTASFTPFSMILGSIILGLHRCLLAIFIANSVDPDQTLHFVVSDLGPHSLPMSFSWDILEYQWNR